MTTGTSSWKSILSAREKLHISYVGQSIQDNSIRPPSVLVSELLDYLEEGFEFPKEKILEQIVHQAPPSGLQPGVFPEEGEAVQLLPGEL